MPAVQLIASDPLNSARVAANAGTGKTHVLTQRVLRMMISGVHPSKILCLTYTKAAAAEMVERVALQMRNWATCTDDVLQNSLAAINGVAPTADEITRARQLFTITLESTPPPRIQTIHSFCQEILRRFPLEAGISPNFEVIDDRTSAELAQKAKQRILQKIQLEPSVLEAVEFVSTNCNEWKFDDLLGQIKNSRNKFKDASAPIKPQVTAAEITDNFFADKKTDAAFNALCAAMQKHGIATDLKHLARLKSNDIFLYKKVFDSARIVTASVKKNLPNWEEIIAVLAKEIAEIDSAIRQIKTAEFSYYTYQLAHGYLEIYDNLKSNDSWLDYDDLLYLTKKLLTAKGSAQWVLYKLDGGIDHVMIDEAQDTSPDQWEIISALTSEFFAGNTKAENARSVFIVGDEKQSIYSFQGAKPQAFNNFTVSIATSVKAAENNWFDLPLNLSYRSTAPVLQVVDRVFENLQTKHFVSRDGQAGRVELWPIIKGEGKPEHEDWHLPTMHFTLEKAQVILAEKIATTIKQWLNSGRILESAGRAVNASDILIVLRRRGDLADLIIKKLKENSVPVSGADRLKLGQHIAAEDLVALGKFMLLPQDDLNLACLLKSPLFGVSEDELFKFCHNRTGFLWDNLPQNLRTQLEDLFNKADYMPVFELYSYVLDVCGGRKKFISRLGFEVNEILDEFLQLTLDFEKQNTNSLQKFLHWFGSNASEIKRDMEQNQAQVRVMTVHASKGLQAPIVFVADATYSPNRHDYDFIWDNNKFLAVPNAASASDEYLQLKTQNEAEDYNEYLRLLYVALTRAADELYICGSEGERKIADNCWYKIIEPVMQEIAVINDDGAYVLTCPQTSLPQTKRQENAKNIAASLPEFLQEKLQAEIAPAQENKKIYESAATAKGKLVHKQLEYSDIFAGSLAEVPVIGYLNGKLVRRRIDRLLFKNDEVHIIDIKTGSGTASQYASQLNEYAKLIALSYPSHKPRKFIYWAETEKLEELD